MRITDEDEAMLDYLCDLYNLDRAKLIRHCLLYVKANLPTFTIEPDIEPEPQFAK
jgi:hypothetical protein